MDNEQIIYVGEKTDEFPIICQYVVKVGSNDEPLENNGISHLIEHYIINNSYHTRFFENVKIHGFTHFYFTCYYWYVSSLDEAKISIQEFEKIIFMIKKNLDEYTAFLISKRQIVEEIKLHKIKCDRIYKILLELDIEEHLKKLPMGNLKIIDKMEHCEVLEYLKSRYTAANVKRYVYDRDYNIWLLLNEGLEKLNITLPKVKDVLYGDAKFLIADTEKNADVLKINCNLESDSVKIIFKDFFGNVLVEIILGEIFMMQVCDYLKQRNSVHSSIRYEKFFISEEYIFFIITIEKTNKDYYSRLMEWREINIVDTLNEIVGVDSYKVILNSIIEFVRNFDSSEINESDFRMDLVNHSTLLYTSYSLINEKSEIIKELEGVKYSDYYEYLLGKVSLFGQNNIKIFY